MRHAVADGVGPGRELLPRGVTGFRIDPFPNGLAMLDPSNVRDDWLQGPGMAAMWECAAETGQAICVLINPCDLPDVDAMCKPSPSPPPPT